MKRGKSGGERKIEKKKKGGKKERVGRNEASEG